MATTNFAALTDEEKKVWSRDVWKAARNMSRIEKFIGTGPNSMIQRVTELTKTERGTQAVLTLVADLEGDGVVGDNTLEGNEEAIKAYDQVIQIDQIRNANRHKGRMAEQRSVVRFRENSKDALAYWLAERLDQLAFLTMSGVSYEFHTNMAPRGTSSQLSTLAYASDVTAPSANRHYRWDPTDGLVAGDTTAVAAGDTPGYKMLVEMKAQAKTNFIRGMRSSEDDEMYHVFIGPRGMSKLKLDSDFLANLRSALPRDKSNPLFSGGAVTQDGLVIHEMRNVINTTGAASGSKWGASGTVDGERILLCGAQALGFADLGLPYWDETGKDYGNQQGISIGKIAGFKKPVFQSQVSSTEEDFGVMCVDVAIQDA